MRERVVAPELKKLGLSKGERCHFREYTRVAPPLLRGGKIASELAMQDKLRKYNFLFKRDDENLCIR